MKDNMEVRLEELTTKIVQGAGLQKPSADFTSRVMLALEQQTQSAVTVYTPLISKRMWWVIGSAIVVLVGYILSANIEFNVLQDAFTSVNSQLPQWQLPSYELDVAVPNTLVYGVLIMVVLLAIEIPLLKRKYNW